VINASVPSPDGRPGHEPDNQHPKARTTVVAISATVLSPFIVLYRALRSIWSDGASRGLLIMAALLLIAGTIIFMVVEDFSPIDSFYFSFITLATIGYGDFSPSTDLGKLVTVVYSFAGLGIMAALIRTIATQRRSGSRERTTEGRGRASEA
jgi:hypothetical protein